MSRRRVLDTNRLISHWCRSRRGPLDQCTREQVRQWAHDLIEKDETNAVLTPVVLEFLCGARDSHELMLYREFLSEFEIIDRGHITDEDWKEASRYASRTPRDGKPRDFADCLIRAIADRLRYDPLTSDEGFSR